MSLALRPSQRADEGSPSAWIPSERGTLILSGGGWVPRGRFVELAGGKSARLVVIPTAGESADDPAWDPAELWHSWGVQHVTVLHTRDRGRADDPSFCRPIDEATAVWISGGTQSWLSEAYAGTEVERALARLLARGGVVGGTSAGASILSKVMISGGRDEVEVGVGFDLAPGVVIDQHFFKQNRMKRLSRILADHGELIGLGIDEDAAIEFNLSHNRLRAIGYSYTMICVPAGPDSDGELRIEFLKKGDEADLNRIRDRSANAVIPWVDIESL
ncbi:MAG: cyanophycinase [Isosphaeraceae bacterium]